SVRYSSRPRARPTRGWPRSARVYNAASSHGLSPFSSSRQRGTFPPQPGSPLQVNTAANKRPSARAARRDQFQPDEVMGAFRAAWGEPRHRLAGWAAVGWLVLAVGCAMPVPAEPPRQAAEAGPAGRRQPLALTPRQELAVGLRAYQEVLGEFRGRVLPEDSPEV